MLHLSIWQTTDLADLKLLIMNELILVEHIHVIGLSVTVGLLYFILARCLELKIYAATFNAPHVR